MMSMDLKALLLRIVKGVDALGAATDAAADKYEVVVPDRYEIVASAWDAHPDDEEHTPPDGYQAVGPWRLACESRDETLWWDRPLVRVGGC